MVFGFDLDGTLDKPVLTELARTLLAAGHTVHIITGTFADAGTWQDEAAKFRKVERLGFDACFYENKQYYPDHKGPWLHVLNALPHEQFARDYRLIDLGLRKGELCERLGIQIMMDDSETYCKMIPAMAGGTAVLHVR